MIKIKSKNIVHYLFCVVMLCSWSNAKAQISGNSHVNVGETHIYTLNNNTLYIGYQWVASKGAKIDSTRVGTEYKLHVTWNETGIGNVAFKAFVGGTLDVINETNISIALPQPIITINGSTTISLGESRTLSTSGTYDSYQWLKNGIDISGETGASLVVSDIGSYKLRVTDNGVSSESDPLVIFNQVISQNFNLVRSVSVLESGVQSESDFGQVGNANNVRQSVTYIDGLGRPIQTVSKEESQGSFDLVQHIEYDNFGRQQKNYLPYTLAPSSISGSNDGTFKTSASIDQVTFYDDHFNNTTSGDFAFSETTFEKSPLSRALETFAPGQPWSRTGGNKPVSYEYLLNEQSDIVLGWTIEKGFLMAYSFYEAGELYKTVTLDENTGTDEGEVIEFKNKQGQVILKRVKKDASDYLETYYTYDDFGNLRYVLPPMASANYVSTDLEAPTGYTLVTDDLIITSNDNSKYAYIPSASVTVQNGVDLGSGFESIVHGVVPTQDFLDKWTFQYKYDERQRMIEKKVPGADWVYMVYDDKDRLVLTQDGNQRSSNTWSFTKYDQLNRPVITGEKVLGSRSTVETALAANTSEESYDVNGLHKYTNTAYPTGTVDSDINSITYYDNYQYTSKAFIDPPAGRFTTEDSKILPSDFDKVKGQITGTKTKILGSTNGYTKTLNFYDDRYRLIQTQITNHKGGKDVITTQYDFAGRVRKTFMEFDNPSGDISSATIAQNYTYDHASRLLTVDHSIDGATPIVIVTNTYNELGELENKKLHEESANVYAQSIDYAYNMRGWLTKMNDPSVTDPATYFSMNLKYDNATSGHQAYNGNIGTIDWKNPLESTINRYDFDYDRVNRLTAADHNESTNYDVTGINYDDNGNIKNLIRNGKKTNGIMGTFDNLTYTYANGNQLSKVEDSSSDEKGFKNGVNQTTEYTYDANGNMITDANKGIVDIDYNYLNLPEIVDMGGNNRIEYDYDAAGIKLTQRVYENNTLTKTTDYLGGFIYEDNNLQFIQHEEGRIVPNAGSWEYQYGLKDHLGNTRVTFTTEDRVTDYDATFEDANNTAENVHFYNLINRAEYPYTVAADKAQRLNSAAPVGAGISLGVVPGDKIDLSVKAYYNNTSGFGTGATSSGPYAAAVAGAFGGVNGGTEAQQATFDLFNNLAASLLTPAGNVDNKPSAYLNYLVFDKDYVLNTSKSGYQGVVTGANSEQTLSASDIEIEEAGYVYIYLSNESNSSNYVYFDNLSVTVNESRILEKSDYYPFGLTFNSYNKAGMIGQNFKYNGKEHISDLGVNWDDFGFRMYQPDLVRFFNVDPLADSSLSLTPYHYVANNPILFTDPDGRDFNIWYKNEDGSNAKFTFNGSNGDSAPDNKFVQQFLTAYNYNVENGGGDKLQEVAENGDIKIGVAQTENSSQHQSGNIFWNPNAGAEYENGTVVSPSTVLEHEADHANQRATKFAQFREDKRVGKEELRVINGSEQKTARANGEIPANGVTRTRHEGQSVITYGPTSNKINRTATKTYRQKQLERAKKSFDAEW